MPHCLVDKRLWYRGGALLLIIGTLLSGWNARPAYAAGVNGPQRPLRGTLPGTQAPQQPLRPHLALNDFTISDYGQTDYETSSSDPVNGTGDDDWITNFPKTVTITVTVTDEYIVGDNYTVYVDGNDIGTTPAEPLNGPTYSSGSFAQDVAPGTHTITVQDIGGITYYNEGNSYMIPAGFHVTIDVEPSKIQHPVILVHGINESAGGIGTKSNQNYSPIISRLESIYNNETVDVFKYVDDIGGCSAKPCLSQSSIEDNARQLAKEIQSQYTAYHNTKVALIGYSMGAAIIRDVLAGCPDDSSLLAPGYHEAIPNFGLVPKLCVGVAQKVDNVFFLDGAQQGSYLMDAYLSLERESLQGGVGGLTATVLRYASYQIAKGLLNLDANNPAERDLTPLSYDIQSRDAVQMPTGIHYFNFFGDIRLHLTIDVLVLPLTLPTQNIGDMVLLPGVDAPTVAPPSGGARFCLNCAVKKGYSANHINDQTSYDQWDLAQDVSSSFQLQVGDLPNLGTIASNIGEVATLKQNLASAPMWHMNITKPASLADIKVADPTGVSDTVTIPQEIGYQLESQDNILP